MENVYTDEKVVDIFMLATPKSQKFKESLGMTIRPSRTRH